jgi:hypothetical protein
MDDRDPSVARLWNEALLASISRDVARPTVHARNLWHVSAAMYDAWAAYDDTASTWLNRLFMCIAVKTSTPAIRMFLFCYNPAQKAR